MVSKWSVVWYVHAVAYSGGGVSGAAGRPSDELLGSIDGAAGNCFGVAGRRKACEHRGGETLLERGDHVDRGFVERRHGRGERSPL